MSELRFHVLGCPALSGGECQCLSRRSETPDFERLARSFIGRRFNIFELKDEATLLTDTVSALRLVWNARGAADLNKLEAALSSLMGVTAAGPYVKNLDRAIRSLDR